MRQSRSGPKTDTSQGRAAASDRRSVGLREVARVAGVSTATVSRAMNNPEIVSADLRARIDAAVQQLGWVPDGAARALSTRRSQTIGAVFPALSIGEFARATHAIQSELARLGYTLLLACSEYDPAQELSQVRKFVERGVDGLILVGQAHHPDTERLLHQRKIPYVNTFVYDRSQPGTCVGPDNHRALQMMTDHLADLGHVRFAAIAQSTLNNDRAGARLEGMRHALALRGLAARPQHVLIGKWTIGEGRALFRKLMQTDPRPTAIICGNAHLTVGAVLEALAMGLRLPDDVSIVGYDDIEVMSHLPVPVTTVRVPGDRIGATAARLLVSRLENKPFSEPLEAEAEIVIRSSSGPPPKDS
ncbi:LacI family DNA-binding transcriptional regulator [Bosea sp. (in: a-proteobacteria)]|uniref:LacI family DNA-binding transcriptional regulator n=1 Tax=Bosea sp. (in: a-proteobacteria) TaxID=1871050 RepID=UPI0026390DD7|nr:LacI family DNA-binding transcriptional regulator [Bosea sp. (in: a-proteobacteria)]MCO5090356.1 LacI family DNA-binding transcriptional regulator [Bosea sp. (in: a-proteobacteria)]